MGSCMSIEEPPAKQVQRNQQVVSYPASGLNYPTVKPSAPPLPITTYPPPGYTYAQMPQQQQQQQQGTQWVQAPYQYQYQMYPPPQQQQYYVQQPQQQQVSAGTAFVGGIIAGAVISDMFDDPY